MRTRGIVSSAIITSAAVVLSAGLLQARPPYNMEFWAKYDKELGAHKEMKCAACHNGGDDKKKRNDYAKAFGEALGEKNSKNVGKIKEALDKAAKEKSGTEGKTFGDLIKDGKMPGK
jgi:hypothetical protein